MARENQGLQISLIVFVMLTIIFGVISFVCYRSYTDAVAKADAETKAKNDVSANLQKANDDISKLKAYSGFSATEQIDAITTLFAREMEAYLGKDAPAGVTAVPQADRSYRKAVQYLGEAYQKKSSEQEAELNSNRTLTAKFAEREKLSQAQIDKFKKAAEDASAELEKTREAYNQTRANIEKQQGELLTRVQNAEKTKNEVQTQTTAQLAAAQQEITRYKNLLAGTKQQIENFQKQTFEVANGKVEWVNQRQKAVWVNVGAADYLNRMMTFSVYDSNATDVSQAEKKATIEITQILGPHLAEARIVEETVAGNPILPGDVIYTPIWRPGQQRRFAVAGFIDIDKDGKSDLDKVLQLIQLNGGVVNVYYDDTGKIHPDGALSDINKLITDRTSAVILGAAPTEATAVTSKDAFTAYQAIMRAAGRYAIKSISVADFLTQVGYRAESRVINYGPGTDPNQFRPRAPEGTQKKSTGNVFQPRKPTMKPAPAAILDEESAKPGASKQKQP